MIRSLRTHPRVLAISLLFASVLQIPIGLTSGVESSTSAADRFPAAIRSCERLFESTGPREITDLPGFDDADDVGRPAQLRIAHYNLQNYKVWKDPNVGAVEPKAVWAKNRIAEQIKREAPDVLFVSEVVGEVSLRELQASLDDVYEAHLFEGNDPFSMIAILIRKTLPFRVTLQSHRALKHRYNSELVSVFTRDLVVADFTYPGDSVPTVSVAGSHLKSNRSTKFSKNFDEHSTEKRFEQARTAAQVLNEHRSKVKPLATVFVGDFNADIRNDSELSPLRNNGFTDAMSVVNVPENARGTHTYIQKSHSKYLQFDGLFVSDEIVASQAIESAFSVPDRDENGRELPLPKTREELQNRASDHRMVIMTLDLKKLRASGKK